MKKSENPVREPPVLPKGGGKAQSVVQGERGWGKNDRKGSCIFFLGGKGQKKKEKKESPR